MAIDPKNKKSIDDTSAYVQDTLYNVAGNIGETIKESIESAFDGAEASAIKALGNDLTRNFNTLIKSSNEFSANTYKAKEGLIGVKDIARELQKVEIKRLQLENKIIAARKMAVPLNEESLEAARDALKEQKEQLDVAKTAATTIKTAMGTTGEIFSRIAKNPLFGSILNAEKGLVAMRKAAGKGTKGFKLMALIAG